MERHIVHTAIPDLPVVVARLKEKRLRGRPVIIAPPDARRAWVYAASEEARQAGIIVGMSVHRALQRCRDLQVRPPEEALYARATRALADLVGQFSPLVEPVRYGQVYFDLTGTTRLFGPARDTTARARREILQRLQLPSVLGLATNKLVSKIAALVAYPDVLNTEKAATPCPAGLYDVPPGDEEAFIAPRRVEYLPGVRPPVREQLLELNVRLIRELARLSLEHLTLAFGHYGVYLHQWARGIDPRPVQPPHARPQLFEQHRFDEDTNDPEVLAAVLYRLVEHLALRLRLSERMALRLRLDLTYSDRYDVMAHTRLPLPSDSEVELFMTAQALLEKILTRRVRVRQMALGLFDFVPTQRQTELFESAARLKRQVLTEALDCIRHRFGMDAIQFGRTWQLAQSAMAFHNGQRAAA